MKLSFVLRFTSADAIRRTLWSLSRLAPVEGLSLDVLLVGKTADRESLKELTALNDRGQIRAVCREGDADGCCGIDSLWAHLDSDYLILASGGVLFDADFLSVLNPELTRGSAIIKGRYAEDDWIDRSFVRFPQSCYRGLDTLVIRRELLLKVGIPREDNLFHSRLIHKLLKTGENLSYVGELKVIPVTPLFISRKEILLFFKVMKELASLWEKELSFSVALSALAQVVEDCLRFIAAIEDNVSLRKNFARELCEFVGALQHTFGATHPEVDVCAALSLQNAYLTRCLKERDSDRLCFAYDKQRRAQLEQSLSIRQEEGQAFERYYRTLGRFVLRECDVKAQERFYLVTSSTMHPLYREQFELYFDCNPFLKTPGIEVSFVDSSPYQGSLSCVYNRFIDSFNLNEDAWLIFLHCDVEIIDDLAEVFKDLSTDCIYGPCGAVKVRVQGELKNVFTGFNDHQRRDRQGFMQGGANLQYAGPELKVDTLDCLMVAIHTSLLRRYPLRFDEHLIMDAVVEDFCMQAMESYGIESRLVKLQCCHHSNSSGDTAHQSQRFYEALRYVNHKYPQAQYAGTCAMLGGRSLEGIHL